MYGKIMLKGCKIDNGELVCLKKIVDNNPNFIWIKFLLHSAYPLENISIILPSGNT